MPKNVLRQVKLIVYKLKRSFGLSLHIWHPISTEHNVETGKIAREYQLIYIRLAILLPKTFARDFEYDLTYIASGKNFVYGGFFDSARRNIIIDVDDLPKNFELTNNDFLVFEEKRWEIESIELSEHGQSYFIRAKEVASYDDINAVYNVEVDSDVNYRVGGNYYLNGICNGNNAYCSYNGKYWLWYNPSASGWTISVTKGALGIFNWSKGDATITGSYSPHGVALGSVIVATI